MQKGRCRPRRPRGEEAAAAAGLGWQTSEALRPREASTRAGSWRRGSGRLRGRGGGTSPRNQKPGPTCLDVTRCRGWTQSSCLPRRQREPNLPGGRPRPCRPRSECPGGRERGNPRPAAPGRAHTHTNRGSRGEGRSASALPTFPPAPSRALPAAPRALPRPCPHQPASN